MEQRRVAMQIYGGLFVQVFRLSASANRTKTCWTSTVRRLISPPKTYHESQTRGDLHSIENPGWKIYHCHFPKISTNQSKHQNPKSAITMPSNNNTPSHRQSPRQLDEIFNILNLSSPCLQCQHVHPEPVYPYVGYSTTAKKPPCQYCGLRSHWDFECPNKKQVMKEEKRRKEQDREDRDRDAEVEDLKRRGGGGGGGCN